MDVVSDDLARSFALTSAFVSDILVREYQVHIPALNDEQVNPDPTPFDAQRSHDAALRCAFSDGWSEKLAREVTLPGDGFERGL